MCILRVFFAVSDKLSQHVLMCDSDRNNSFMSYFVLLIVLSLVFQTIHKTQKQ